MVLFVGSLGRSFIRVFKKRLVIFFFKTKRFFMLLKITLHTSCTSLNQYTLGGGSDHIMKNLSFLKFDHFVFSCVASHS